MLRSLVGSEMCIRDRPQRVDHAVRRRSAQPHLGIRQSWPRVHRLSVHPQSHSLPPGGDAEFDCARPHYQPCVKSRTLLEVNLFLNQPDIGFGDLEISQCDRQQILHRWSLGRKYPRSSSQLVTTLAAPVFKDFSASTSGHCLLYTSPSPRDS